MDLYSPYGHGIHADPYPTYARMREEEPLCYNAELDFYALSRFEDVWNAVHAPEIFSSADGIVLGAGANDFIPMMIMMDPPRHDHLRSLVSRAFTPRRVNEMEGKIREATDELIDEFADADSVDLIAALAGPLPTIVIAEMMGIPREDRDDFKSWSNDLARSDPGPRQDVEKSTHAATSLFNYFKAVIKDRTANPRDDLMTALVQAEINGEKITANELLGFCILLLVAGNETTTNLVGNASVHLGGDHELLNTLRADPSLLPAAVEEFVRLDSPVQGLARTLLSDYEMYGQTMPKGAKVMLLFGAANRDEREFPNPDKLDLYRKAPRHLAFGHGVHYCLGASLARLEGRVVFEHLLRRKPNFTVQTPVDWIDAGPIRGPVSLHLQFENA